MVTGIITDNHNFFYDYFSSGILSCVYNLFFNGHMESRKGIIIPVCDVLRHACLPQAGLISNDFLKTILNFYDKQRFDQHKF
ncbi:hypothetical protein LV83_00717 [Algoriphagus yeomjeoni]|uniref:Uncharacterized protein n=1 Tax=Algoriphagus yeomjeoni TaxID=291403 RepID=A0A327PR78_9BACT|nr:hypothetical protein LV83_00717 [Algoriphagus yeomjeoni]